MQEILEEGVVLKTGEGIVGRFEGGLERDGGQILEKESNTGQ